MKLKKVLLNTLQITLVIIFSPIIMIEATVRNLREV